MSIMLKGTAYIMIGSLLVGIPTQDSRKKLLCHKWRMIGQKPFNRKFTKVPASERVLTFFDNGTYSDILYGQVHMKGRWKVSPDSTKLGFELTDFNGKQMSDGLPLDRVRPTDSLLRLTKDTLIYGSLARYGPAMIYGHDDKYFVRED